MSTLHFVLFKQKLCIIMVDRTDWLGRGRGGHLYAYMYVCMYGCEIRLPLRTEKLIGSIIGDPKFPWTINSGNNLEPSHQKFVKTYSLGEKDYLTKYLGVLHIVHCRYQNFQVLPIRNEHSSLYTYHPYKGTKIIRQS